MPSFEVAPLHSRLSSCAPFLFLLFSFLFFGSCAVHAHGLIWLPRGWDVRYSKASSLTQKTFS